MRRNSNQPEIETGITTYLPQEVCDVILQAFYKEVVKQEINGKVELKSLPHGFMPVPTVKEKVEAEKRMKENMKFDMDILYKQSVHPNVDPVISLQLASQVTNITDMYRALEEHNIWNSYDTFHVQPSMQLYQLLHDVIIVPNPQSEEDYYGTRTVAIVAYYSNLSSTQPKLVEQFLSADETTKLEIVKQNTRPVCAMVMNENSAMPMKACANLLNSVDYTDKHDPEIVMTALVADTIMKQIYQARVDSKDNNC